MVFLTKNTNSSLSFIFVLFPILMITGPAIPDIFVSLSALYGLILYFTKTEYKNFNFYFFYCFIIFWIFAFTSSILSDFKLFSLESSLPYIRFIFFVALFIILLKYDKMQFNKYIFIVITLTVTFVAFDTYLQFFFRNEIFGNKIDLDQNRLTGPFRGDERVVGSYLSRFVFLGFGYLLYKFSENKYYKIIPFIFLLFVYICIFLSGERMAFILTSFGILLSIIFNYKSLKYFIYLLVGVILFSSFIIFNNDSVKNRMIKTTFEVIGFNFNNGKISKSENSFIDSHYGAHYITAFEIFKDNKFFGSGPKTFRKVCSNEKYSELDSKNIFQRCSTHPHNYYMQIISETGLFGILIFGLSVVFLISFSIMNLNLINPLHNGVFISLLLFIWPIQSTGSIFNNWYGVHLYYYIILIFILIKQKNLATTPSS